MRGVGAAVQDTPVSVALPAALALREPLTRDFSFSATGMGEEDASADHSQCHLQRAISPLSPLFLHAESN